MEDGGRRLEIRLASSTAEALATWPMLQKVPLVNMHPHVLLGQFLLGQNALMLAYVDDHLEGCMYFQLSQQTIDVQALYLPRLLRAFWPKFMDWCKETGLKRMVAVSRHAPEKYKRLFGMDVLWTTYGRDL
jgi:hypothetical protein